MSAPSKKVGNLFLAKHWSLKRTWAWPKTVLVCYVFSFANESRIMLELEFSRGPRQWCDLPPVEYKVFCFALSWEDLKLQHQRVFLLTEKLWWASFWSFLNPEKSLKRLKIWIWKSTTSKDSILFQIWLFLPGWWFQKHSLTCMEFSRLDFSTCPY